MPTARLRRATRRAQVGCTRVVVANVRFINSPFYHIVSVDCHGLRLEDLYIHAPLDSKNTDGISLMVRGCGCSSSGQPCFHVPIKPGARVGRPRGGPCAGCEHDRTFFHRPIHGLLVADERSLPESTRISLKR